MTKRKVPNIVRGGIAIPLKNKTNYYYMSGRKHEDGGIDIGKNPRTGLEVEDGEVMHITDDTIKVFSAQPFLNGDSPANKVMKGENPNRVFNKQERFKKVNGLNDDGTKKKKALGGSNRIYSVTSNGKTSLRMIPSTGEEIKDITMDNNSNVKRNKAKAGIKQFIKDNSGTILDTLGTISNIGFSIAGKRSNDEYLNKMKYTDRPVSKTATKLKTRININPQLDKMRESLAAYEQSIRNNTASSKTALSRQQRVRLANTLNTNELYGNKENIETELINKDRMNQQNITNSNIDAYNRWRENKATFDNVIIDKKSENVISTFNSINKGIQDTISSIEKDNAEDKTITAMSLANPNLPAEMFLASGIWTQQMYDTYRKSYPLTKKK